ncbi:restriction endonuclease subunit S [Pseudotabrizicola sp.]|uniref:restriction endonuclease subunit S n=1 Tax=Pseudotabrizicola sp. TaxID=2939647 RepID=UPI00351EFB76
MVGIPVHGANGIIGWTNKVLYSHGVPLVTCRGSNCGMVLWAEGPLWVSNNSMAILPSGDLDLRFIYYNLLNSPPLEFVSGSAQPQITMGDLSKKAFLVPPLREQRAIATTLGALDDKIELNRKMNATLEAMARALFRDWFVDFGPTRAKMKARAPYLSPDLWSLFPDRLDDEGKPEGWTVRTLGDVADQIAMGPFGSNIKVETFVAEGIPVISGAHLRGLQLADKDYNFITEVHADKLRRSNVRRSDIVFTHAGNIGQVAIIPETAEFDRYVISQRQ